MKITHIFGLGLANLILLGGCTSIQPPGDRHDALVLGYQEASYNLSHPESAYIRLLVIDGRVIDDPEAPLRLRPGPHTLVVSCTYSRPWVNVTDPSVSVTLNARAGTVYNLYPVATDRQDDPRCRVDVRRQSSSS